MNISGETFYIQELSFQNFEPNELDKFRFIASKVLNSYGPQKKKYIRWNQAYE